MISLETRTLVANHPNMMKLRLQLDSMRRRLNNDYGVNFMGIEIKDETDVIFERDNGQEGVNRWTPVERKQWFALDRRIKALRAALTESYNKVQCAYCHETVTPVTGESDRWTDKGGMRMCLSSGTPARPHRVNAA